MSIDSNAVIYASNCTNLSRKQAETVLSMLLEEDCTIPFITRYRKDKTGGLDEVQILSIKDTYEEYLEMEKRRSFILEAIAKLDQMTPELERKIKSATKLNQLEDLYAPYKMKKKTKGMIARDAGLEPLAEIMLTTLMNLKELENKHGNDFLAPDKKIKTFEDAVNGAFDIITERMAHDIETKERLRNDYWKEATIVSTKKEKAEVVKDFLKFKDYFEFEMLISELKNPKAGHRFMAMKRGMALKILKVNVNYSEEAACGLIEKKFLKNESGLFMELAKCVRKAYCNYIHPSLDLEVKSELKKLSDESAISVFGINVKNLLLAPYLGPKTVLGIDPGVVTGCKLAVVDNTGKFVLDTVIYPHPPKNQTSKSADVVAAIIEKFNVEYIAIGNGTYGRETLTFVSEYVNAVKSGTVKAMIISEAGASIYSTSEIARKEFPEKDPTVRGAISLARRFQDPMAELIKIDPKSIGVGQYQHDVNQTRLKKTLNTVVESCVNFVGVDINTASAPLLSFVSGIGPALAVGVVKYREKNGGIKSRNEFLKIGRFTEKIFQQAAGFLRIYNGDNPMDGTFIHPESYNYLEDWAKKNNILLENLVDDQKSINLLESDSVLSEKIGGLTFSDIIKSLKAPSQDPRTEFKSTEFRKDVTKIGDVKLGEWYPGIVTNITQFGAFVDIGIKENGLVHVSQISDKFVKNALDVLKVGQELKVKVLSVDFERKRLSLSCKTDGRPVHSNNSYKKTERTNKPKKADGKKQTFKNNAFAGLKDFKIR